MRPIQMLRIFRQLHLLVLCSAVVCMSAPAHAQAVSTPAPILKYGRGLPQLVQFSPQGDIVLVTTPQGDLWRYDARSLETIDSVPGIVSARYSSSGAWLFTQDTDQTWSIRRADDPAEVIAEGFSTVWQSPDSTWIVTADAGSSALRPDDNPAQVALEGLDSVYFGPAAAHVLTFDPSAGFVLRAADLSPLAEQPGFPAAANAVYWSPDGGRIAFFNGADRVDMVAVSAGEVDSFTLPDQERYARAQWSPDSTRLLGSDDMGNVRIWNAATGQLVLELPTGEPYVTPEERAADPYYPPDFWHITWSADGSHVFRCVSYGGDIYETCRFYDATTGEEVGQADGNSLGRLQTDPEDRYFIALEGVFDATSGQLIAPFTTSIDGGGRVFSPEGRRVALSSPWQPDIHIYDLDALRPEHTLDIPPGRYDYASMTWSPDGARLATWGRYSGNGVYGSGLISFWDMSTGREAGRISEHILFSQQMAFSTDSSQLAAADNLGNIALFDTSTGELSRVLGGLEERAAILAWQPGGTLLAATTGRIRGYSDPPDSPLDGTQVRIWDMRTGELVTTLQHTQTVIALLWHPSGGLLVTDDFTGTSVWNAETGTRQQFPAMSGGLTSAGVRYRWTRDGGVLVRGHYNCSHGGGDSLNFLDMETLQQAGPIHCSGHRPYEWNELLDGIPEVTVQCASATPDSGERCQIQAVVLFQEPETEIVQQESQLSRPRSYEFGQFDEFPQPYVSPDSANVAVVTDSTLQVWHLHANSAALLWSAEAAANVIWSNDGDALLLVTDDSVRIVSGETGTQRVIIPDISPDVSEIEWSQDDAFILVRSAIGAVVFDASSGERMPLPDGVEQAFWEYGFLRFSQPATGESVWWNVQTGRVAFFGDQIPTAVSADSTFGAEARSGVLRLWRLNE